MLIAEADWVGNVLSQLDAKDLSPLLNVGSETSNFRETVQPWSDRAIFAPLRNRGVAVHHLDLEEGEGIDICGDLNDDSFLSDLKNRGYRSLICCDVLEHVVDAAEFCVRLEQLVPVGGYIVLGVPNAYPYHPHPIDTMFRPNIEELALLFSRSRKLEGAIIDCGSAWTYVDRDPRVLIAKVKRRLSSSNDHGGVKGSASFLPWIFRRFKETCLLLQRES